MTEVAVADIGGTHARFALAEVEGGRIVSLTEPVTLKTAEHSPKLRGRAPRFVVAAMTCLVCSAAGRAGEAGGARP